MESTIFYEAEHLAIIEVFPICTICLCDFQREQLGRDGSVSSRLEFKQGGRL